MEGLEESSPVERVALETEGEAATQTTSLGVRDQLYDGSVRTVSSSTATVPASNVIATKGEQRRSLNPAKTTPAPIPELPDAQERGRPNDVKVSDDISLAELKARLNQLQDQVNELSKEPKIPVNSDCSLGTGMESARWINPNYPQMFPYHAVGGSIDLNYGGSVASTAVGSGFTGAFFEVDVNQAVSDEEDDDLTMPDYSTVGDVRPSSEQRWKDLQEKFFPHSLNDNEPEGDDLTMPDGITSDDRYNSPEEKRRRWEIFQKALQSTDEALQEEDVAQAPPAERQRQNPRSKGKRQKIEPSGRQANKSSLVFMHPEEVKEMRPYTPEELEKVRHRPFPSRLFITNVQVAWNTVWLRTRHTDHHAHRSTFLHIRNVFKADAIANNPPGAKYALTELLNMCFGMEDSEFYSFACTVASALSSEASNTEFERGLLLHFPDERRRDHLRKIEDDMRRTHRQLTGKQLARRVLEHEQELARKRIRQLLHIVFSKVKQKKMLLDDRRDNIYRLVLCMTKYNCDSSLPFLYAAVAFVFQIVTGLFVILSLTTFDEDENAERWHESWVLFGRNIALALCTLSYGLMIAFPELRGAPEVFSVAVCGFFVVLSAETFLDGVISAAALYFIVAIDKQLVPWLELDTKAIVHGFLMDQALGEYETQRYSQEYSDLADNPSPNGLQSIQFSDMFLTNHEESGSRPSRGVTFQPFEAFGDSGQHESEESYILAGGSLISLPDKRRAPSSRKRRGGGRQNRKSWDRSYVGGQMQVTNKRMVTSDCLLRKVEWQYTRGFDNTCVPRIGHLRLTKLNYANSTIDIIGKNTGVLVLETCL
ncbi:expressed unknown protein [Seminavis robusta]|uniref:Uncharacterized protein n=1 Tax=Seminavis robusta TaxID=568900 RepID=A0A9N8E1D2_9STRA|nr:expressed unknown protein [Seminavis robusta]|eukprot:Sro409_g137120.1 n/a (823) ;mRNA; r:11257-14178